MRTAPDPVTAPSFSPTQPDDPIVMITLAEAARVSGRTLEEMQALLEAGTFIERFGVTGEGTPMWVKRSVVAWTDKFPPGPVVVEFNGDSVRIPRHILPGVYTLTRTDLPKPATSS